jgi:hypothetical protein
VSDELGVRFVKALATKDRPGLLDVLDPDIDFRALTPGRFWEAASALELVDDVLLGAWFEPTDHIDALADLQTGSVGGGRQRVGYQLVVTNADGPHLVEQQAYYDVTDDRISWLRVMCSGYRAIEPF